MNDTPELAIASIDSGIHASTYCKSSFSTGTLKIESTWGVCDN